MMLLVILGLVVLIFLWAMGVYNNYISLDTENQTAFSNIGTFLQKRLDLIPNLVETVKGYAKHENTTLQNVIEARSRMLKLDLNDINNLEVIRKMENELTKTLKSIMALSESYPDLKANVSFLELQKSLTDIENQIEGARRYYNATVGELNSFVRKFPTMLLAGIFKFRNAEYFKEDVEAKSAPKVSF
ncbi:LemA family protein [Streptobacillus notomytis]|uniref:LemA family protein n=1 Tax=Streptobacillus notomytis TaxID=1712031 RepID=UPI0009357432|nr:LemA family protein [Streptobacillus notomytis]